MLLFRPLEGHTPMLPLAERLSTRDSLVFVAMDTVDALADRVLGIFGEGREVTRIHTYRHTVPKDPTDAQRENRGLQSLTVVTGLRLATLDEVHGPIKRWESVSPVGKGLHIYLSPGLLEGFGFGAYEYESATEEQVIARYHSHVAGDTYSRRRNLTVVEIDGWPGSPNREDRIRIEHWNDHGVCSETLIAFSR